MDRTWTEEEIRKAVEALFVNGRGEQAHRLQLRDAEEKDLGGRILKPAQDCIMMALRDD